MTDAERLDSLQAAIRRPDGTIRTLPRPARHGDVLCAEHGATGNTKRVEQGFVDAGGVFFTRS